MFVKEGLVKEIYISKNEAILETMDKLKSLFPPNLTLTPLKATVGKDLIPVSLSQEDSVSTILEGATNLYVRGITVVKRASTQEGPPQCSIGVVEKNLSTVTQQQVIVQGSLYGSKVVAKVVETPPKVDMSKFASLQPCISIQ